MPDFAPAHEVLWLVASRRAQPLFGKRTQNHVGPVVALRVPCAVRRLRRRRKLAELRQCAAEFPQSAALLSHTKGNLSS